LATLRKVKIMKPVFIEAYACSDYGDAPRFAKLFATKTFCEQLAKLQALCVEHDLSELCVYESPDAWGPGNIEDELRLTCAELVVTKSAFWFKDHPKHSDYTIETRAQDIDVFIEAVSSEGGTPLFFGSNVEELMECVTDAEEKSAMSPV